MESQGQVSQTSSLSSGRSGAAASRPASLVGGAWCVWSSFAALGSAKCASCCQRLSWDFPGAQRALNSLKLYPSPWAPVSSFGFHVLQDHFSFNPACLTPLHHCKTAPHHWSLFAFAVAEVESTLDQESQPYLWVQPL